MKWTECDKDASFVKVVSVGSNTARDYALLYDTRWCSKTVTMAGVSHGNEELKAERFISTKAKGFLNSLTRYIPTVSTQIQSWWNLTNSSNLDAWNDFSVYLK